MQEIGVSGSGTHDEAWSVASDRVMETTRRPVSQQGQVELCLSSGIVPTRN